MEEFVQVLCTFIAFIGIFHIFFSIFPFPEQNLCSWCGMFCIQNDTSDQVLYFKKYFLPVPVVKRQLKMFENM